MTFLPVFIPSPVQTPAKRLALPDIRKGSAIVGSATDASARHVTIDYEGNLNDAVNLRTFEERLQSAAGRHDIRYPTIARMTVPAASLLQVGLARKSTVLNAWIIESLLEPDAFKDWLGDEELPRIGGSVAIWDRAVAHYCSKNNATIHAMAHARDLYQAACVWISMQEDGLICPPSPAA